MSNKKNAINYMDNILKEDEYNSIENMLNLFKKDKEIELEVSFRGVNYGNYMRILEHYANMVDDKNITVTESLDVSIVLPDGNTYRTSILNNDKIDEFTKKYVKANNTEIQKYILSLKPGNDIEIIYKDRGSADKVFIDDLNILFKTTREIPVTKNTDKPTLNGTEKILFRYKQRASFILNDNVRLDVTLAKESPNIVGLGTRNAIYEIEMEAMNRKIGIDVLFSNVEEVLKIVQDSDTIIGKTEAKEVLHAYQTLLGIKTSSTHLDSRNVISIETQHIVKFVPNNYAITDKADGDRYFMFIRETGVYLLTINLVIKKTNLKPEKEYIDTLLDGELIKNENGAMYMAFDVVYAKGIDYRFNEKVSLTQRIIVLADIIKNAFGNFIDFPDYAEKNTDMELEKIKKFYTKQLEKYWKEFHTRLAKNKTIFVARKIYFIPYGIDPSEVFMYADMVWKLYVYNKLTPYKLDGIIYTPINSPYMIKTNAENLDSVPLEYKWKLPSQNSIDFYIEIEKNLDGSESIYYDNTVTHGSGRAYKICRLFVGIIKGSEEKPIQFKIAGREQKANIYLVDGEARDIEGKLIEDKTVVEFAFDNTKTDIDDAYKWIPLKTRYDKTESVQKYHKRYGNNLNIAIRIWRTINNPITEENIASLGNPATYDKEMARLTKTSIAPPKTPTQAYYQKRTAMATGMRAFNNWVKSNMIMTYAKGRQNVLDIGCGRGGDLIKFVNAGVQEYVGIDIDNNGLYVINDSAYNRYKNLKNTHKNVPLMYFINADARGLFTVTNQESIIPNMSDANKKLITKYLSGNKKYSVINCQFTLHYYLSDALSWKNFCQNINDHIDTNGYMLITCFDGKLIYDKMQGKQKMTVSYIDNTGKKNIFFEINKIYNDKDVQDLGMAIDLYNSLISNPGTYQREYLVFPEFLTRSLKENCGLELIETDTFYGLFNLYKNYFTQENGEQIATDMSSKKYEEIKDFYVSLAPVFNMHDKMGDNIQNIISVEEPTGIAIASFKLSMLNRYYIFKRTGNVNISEPARVVNMNHKINLGKIMTPYLDINNIQIDPSEKTGQINKIYHGIRQKYKNTKPSVYVIRHKIIENQLDNEVFSYNKLQLSLLKQGTDPKILLIYKSPEKYFYPISYLNNGKKVYLFDSDKILADLNILIELSEKLNQS